MARVAKVFTGGVGPKRKEKDISIIEGLGAMPGAEHLEGPAVERVKRPPRVGTGDPNEPISLIGGAGALLGAEHLEGPAVSRVAPTPPPRRLPVPPRPAAIETPAPVPEPKSEAPKGGFAFGRGGGVGIVPARETPEIGRVGRILDFSAGVGPGEGTKFGDVTLPKEYTDLQTQKERIMGSIAYRSPANSKEAARVQKQLTDIAKQQSGIRSGVETSLKGEFEAKTKRGKAVSSAEAIRDALDEKQRLRVAEQEQFDIQEERLSTTAAAGVGTEKIKARAAFAGPRPNPADYFDPKEYQSALSSWQEQYRLAPVSGGVGAPAATPQTESYTKYL